ncbi:MAG: hypothetical protein QXW00_01680 [Candidatus Woesearchaeota archaeon]
MSDEYELIPHREILELRKEIAELKEHLRGKQIPEQPGAQPKNLSDSINELLQVFKEATEQLKSKPATSESMALLVQQNEKIAKGLLMIEDTLEEYLPRILAALGQNPELSKTQTSPSPLKRTYTYQKTQPRTIPGFDDVPK